MKQTECFAMIGGECVAINGKRCYGRCAFYKTDAEVESGRAAALARIASLPVEVQDVISANYYNGKYPWEWEINT